MDKQNRYFDFGPFRVDPDQRLLMRGQETIPVTPKAFETLLVLLRNSGRVVLKEDLMQTLWPDTFVEESNLSQHILQLRKVLGSSAQSPQYIITVPGRGYRFAQKVEEVAAENGSGLVVDGHSKQPVNVNQEEPSRRGLWLLTGVLAVIAAVALGFLWRATRPVNRPVLRLNVELPDFVIAEPTTTAGVALSPGGTRVVYTGRSPDGTLRLYTRTLDQDRALPLAGTEGAYGPFLSPDGQTVGFFADGKLKKIPVERGEAVVLCDASRGFGGSWSEDGTIIAALNSTGGLSQISSGDGTVRLITQLNSERSDLAHIWPQVLPQADSVLFTALSTNADIFGATVDVQSLRTGERKTLVRDAYYGRYVPGGHLLYMHGRTLYIAPMDGKRLALTGPAVPVIDDIASSSSSGAPQVDFSRSGTLVYVRRKADNKTLMWLDNTGQMQPLRATSAEYNPGVRWSPDGKRLALAIVENDSIDVWVYEWERDTMTRLTFGSDAWFPMWSPDGKHIVFMSAQHGGAPNLYYMRADGAGEAVRLTQSQNRQIPYSFSPDGGRLAFFEFNPKTTTDIWTLPLEEANSDHPKVGKPEPFLVTRFDERAPMISPDGSWLAYESNESGRNEIYVQPFPGPGGRWQISTAGGDRPVWSRKASELFYRSSEGMMVASYSARGETFAANKPRLWAAKKDLETYFDLAPDGKRFAVLQAEESQKAGSERVMLLQDFFDRQWQRASVNSR